MSRRAGAALALSALLWAGGCGGGDGAVTDPDAQDAPGAEALELAVDLHFPADSYRLGVERRELASSRDPRQQAMDILTALLAGPQTEGLAAPLPDGVEVSGFYLSDEGYAFVDLRGAEGAGPPQVGSAAELQMVYSLVNSLTLNVPEIRRVALLWNGAQPASFAGHLDTSSPLAPNPDLVAR